MPHEPWAAVAQRYLDVRHGAPAVDALASADAQHRDSDRNDEALPLRRRDRPRCAWSIEQLRDRGERLARGRLVRPEILLVVGDLLVEDPRDAVRETVRHEGGAPSPSRALQVR